MSQLIFPTLPGLKWPVSRALVPPPVTRFSTPSRREFRARDSTVPLYIYTLQFEFLRQASAYQEWQTLMGFINRVGGSFDDWLFEDVDDNHVTNQLIGIGDAVTTQFQLSRTLGGFLEPVYGVNGAPTVTVDGSAVGPTSISDTGLVTLAAAPAAGKEVRWTGYFFWRCVFSDGQIDFAKNYSTFWELQKLSFGTTKPL